MKIPEVGDVLYAFQWPSDRVGDLQFLSATQEHVAKKLSAVKKESKEEDPDGENMDTGELSYPHERQKPIFYKLIRVE